MGNCVKSLDSSTEVQGFREKATKLMAETKMDLKTWESNAMSSPMNKSTNVLGLRWDKQEDLLFCETPEPKPELIIFKRNVLAFIAKVFDPVGFTCPALLQPKLMLQES